MGPNVGISSNLFSILGVKGGVGNSSLTSLACRLASKKHSKKIAIVDGAPSHHSTTPLFLSTPSTNRHLLQLQPYGDQINEKMIESFFSVSPEGVTYIPVRATDEEASLSPENVLILLGKIARSFDILWLDLSSFPSDQRITFLECSQNFILVSSTDPASLSALNQWEKRLLSLQLDLSKAGLILNQAHPNQSQPKDITPWAKNISILETIPYLGDDFSIKLFESKVIQPPIEKAIGPLVDKMLVFSSTKKTVHPPLQKYPTKENTVENTDGDEDHLRNIHLLHQKLLENLRSNGYLTEQTNDKIQTELKPKARDILDRLIQEMDIPDRMIRQKWVAETLDIAFGLGPLQPLLDNEEVSEIMVNGPEQVYIEKKGLLEKTNVRFHDDIQLRTVIERILAPIGRRIDESQPYVDGRLHDGSRLNAVIPPLSLNGPILTIRKFSKHKLKAEDLIKLGSLSREAADFLGACVKARKNIVVSGGTGSGKTTLLNILSSFIPDNERIVTIEDSAELQLSQDHVVRLEARPANLEGKGQISIRDLVINALRMRPDRIVVGEVRGGEALDMLQAMNTGHDGSLTTAHANSPRDVLSRLETMCLFTGLDLPMKAIREQIARAIHLIVQQSRLPGGKRSVTHISSVQGMEGDVVILQELFKYEEGKGLVRQPFPPSFIGDLNSVGYQWPKQ
jgi:pilus assembly protein CpaF